MHRENLYTAFASGQGAAVAAFSWFVSALPTVILLMSALLTGLQLYVFIRDKLRRPKHGCK